MIFNTVIASRRRAVLFATAAFAIGAPSLARAAETAADAATVASLDEVVVTAQKHETTVQKTPISIAVMKSVDLVNRHVISLEDLGDGSIPSLRVAPFFARNSALTIGMAPWATPINQRAIRPSGSMSTASTWAEPRA